MLTLATTTTTTTTMPWNDQITEPNKNKKNSKQRPHWTQQRWILLASKARKKK